MSGFAYERPTTIETATALLAEATASRVLAGGTDLLVAVRSGAVKPELVVDIKGIGGLATTAWTTEGDLLLGACVTLEQIATDRSIAEEFPALSQAAASVGSVQVRSRATIGGNLANASPCMDTAPALLVLGASVAVASPSGERIVPLQAFVTGVKKTALRPGEIVTSVRVPRPPVGMRSGFDKVKRGNGHDLALVNVAMALDAVVGTLRTAIGACAPTPVLLPPLELAGLSRGELSERLVELAMDHISPISDVRASAEYRADMAAVLCARLVARLVGQPQPRAADPR
jgi:CO/xanthine dehydrogenase FAD-binding subunit